MEAGDSQLDRKFLDQLRSLEQGSPGFLAELISLFFKETTGRLAELSRQVAQKDAPGVQRTAHTLKGSCGNMGASRMQDLCRQLEAAAREGRWTDIVPLASQVEGEYAGVRAALESEKAR